MRSSAKLLSHVEILIFSAKLLSHVKTLRFCAKLLSHVYIALLCKVIFQEVTLSEYTEKTIMYGMIMLFGAVFPLAPLIAVVTAASKLLQSYFKTDQALLVERFRVQITTRHLSIT